jgi:hypothetical protein
MSTIISNHQLPLLRYLTGQKFITVEKAMEFDQRGFRSFLIREWLAYRPGFGFHLTPEGRQAWDLLHHTEIRRNDPTKPLTRYFDYVAYGFQDPRAKRPKQPKKLRLVHRAGAA